MNKNPERAMLAEGTSVKVTLNSDKKMVKKTRLLTKSPYRVGQPRTLVFGAFAALFVAIASVLIFYGCKKYGAENEESIKSHKSMSVETIIDKNDFNWVSGAFLNAFETTLNDFGFGEDADPDICGTQMGAIVQQAIENYGYSYLFDESTINAISTAMLNEEIEYMKIVHQIFFEHLHENINNDIDNLLDEIISSNMQDAQKMRLCIYGKSFIGLNNISNTIALKIGKGEIVVINGEESGECYATYDERWTECMRVRTRDIMENGNPFEIFWGLSPPSIAKMGVVCAWDAARGKYDYLPPVTIM